MFRSAKRDILLVVLGRIGALFAGSLCLFIAAFLLMRSAPGLSQVGIGRLVTDASWHPTTDASGTFSLVAAIAGTTIVTVLATILAVPVGVAAAVGSVYLVRPSVGRAMDLGVGVLAGIPSVVLGLWGLTALVPLIAKLRPPGTSVLAASITLAVMIVPTVYVAAASAFRVVPRHMLDAAIAMGLSRWGTLRIVVLPMARPAIAVGAVLATTRALGETMAVVMVAGNVATVPHSAFDPVRTLTANIALEMAYATGTHRSLLFASGAVLMMVIAVMVVMSRRLMPEVAHA